MVPQKVSIDGSKATKVIAIFCFLEKVPIILWMQKIEVRLFELHPDPIQGGVSPRRDPYCSTTFIMKVTLAVAAQQISILKD